MRKLLVVVAVAFVVGVASAQQKVDQGKPGNQGPWPVTFPGSVNVNLGLDGGLATFQVPCGTMAQTAVDAGSAAINVPTTPLTGRIYVEICLDTANGMNSQVNCLGTGGTPVFPLGSPGNRLNTGDCVTYTIGPGTNAKCIGSALNNILTTTECAQ